MKMVFLKYIPASLVIVIGLSLAASAQQHRLYYKMVKGNDTIGDLKVVDLILPGQRTIQTVIKAEIPAMGFHISLNDQKSARYSNQALQTAVVTRSLFNGKPDRSITLLKESGYTNGSSPLQTVSGVRGIDFSMVMLYTTEPVDKKLIYSEFHQRLVPIKKTGAHTYRITTPDGQTGDYYYEKGICVKIDTKTALATISTVLITNNTTLK